MNDNDKLVDDYCNLLIREELARGNSDYMSTVLGSLKGLFSYSLSNVVFNAPQITRMYMRDRINDSKM